MFSYSEYKNTIKLVESYLRIYDFKEVLTYNPTVFCVLRHDIEFSVDRALTMARIEAGEVGELVEYILKDIETLEHYYEFEVDRFAFHRCGSNPELLEKYVEVPNKINCYAKEFFHYFKGPRPEKIHVHYLADSNHTWKYGHPMYIDYSKYPFKMQLLTHPYSWTENGYENMNNFSKLIRARTDELVHDMNSETTTFPKELLS